MEPERWPSSYTKVSKMKWLEDLRNVTIDTVSSLGQIPKNQRVSPFFFYSFGILVTERIMKYMLESKNAPSVQIINCGYKRDVFLI